MTPTEASKILEALAQRYRDPRALEAFAMARAALEQDPAPLMRAILDASGRTDVPAQLIRDERGETWVTWLHKGPIASAPTIHEALQGLLEKVTK